jgi:putative transposase
MPSKALPAYIANYLKGKSARKILQRFPELKIRAFRGKMWSRSYFMATVGNVIADIVKRYVEEQWAREK